MISRWQRMAVVLALGVAGCASTQHVEPVAYTPAVGQQGKDVVWVPTPQVLVDRMLDMAKVTPADYVIDLGSGDGRTVITAARRGARALGVEYDADMVALSRRNAREAGVLPRAEFVKADLFETDLTQATVITMFLLPELNLKLRPRLLDLRPGTRLVSNSFTMGDWEPDETATLDARQGCDNSWCTALLWIVPAKVAGGVALNATYIGHQDALRTEEGRSRDSTTGVNIARAVSSQRREMNGMRVIQG